MAIVVLQQSLVVSKVPLGTLGGDIMSTKVLEADKRGSELPSFYYNIEG